MTNFDLVRQAFQNSIPPRRDAFSHEVARVRKEKDHRDDMKSWYPNEVLKLAKDEARLRVGMAAARIRTLLDIGWEPTPMLPVQGAFSDLFTRYDNMRKEAYRDLPDAIESAVMDVYGLYPPDQLNESKADPLLRAFGQAWSEAANEQISDLKLYALTKAKVPIGVAARFWGDSGRVYVTG